MSQNANNTVLKRIRGKGKGWVFTPKDMLDIDNRTNIDVILHHLTNEEFINRLDRGIYYYPKSHPKLGVLNPEPLKIAEAIARQNDDVALPDGAKALNILGLSTQVPAQNVFYTAFTDKQVKIGAQTLTLKPELKREKKATPDYLIVQALKYLGPDGITQEIIQKCAQIATERDKKKLMQQLKSLKGTWLVDAVRGIANS